MKNLKKSNSGFSLGMIIFGIFFLWIGVQATGSEATADWPIYIKVMPFFVSAFAILTGLWPTGRTSLSSSTSGIYMSPEWSPYNNPQTGIPLALAKGKDGIKDRKLMN